MPNLRDVKLRIRSVKNTQQMTKAMKLVSASKLRRAQQAILKARPYAVKLMSVMKSLEARCNPDLHPLLEDREGKRILLLVITSDRGLCGAFNANILRVARQVIEKNPGREFSLICAGKKGNEFFKRREVPIRETFLNWTKDFDYLKAQDIGRQLGDMFVERTTDKIYLVYNEFKSVLRQEVILEQLLPIVPAAAEEGGGKGSSLTVDYIYEPDEESILEHILLRHMTVQVYRAFLESSASEHGARMTAMDNASRNASEMLDKLTLFYNRTRQAYITKELIEVVNGAESLKA
ncbi:MAG: ATP synthase F1 subunit gamma [Nitrospinaceae bacterium]